MTRGDPEADNPDTLCAAVADACDHLPQVRTAYVFGSQLQQKHHAASDLDVAVDFDPQLTAQQRGQAKLHLIAALTDRLGPLGERADVVDLRNADPAVAFRVIRDGRRVKDADPPKRVRLEARIARVYDDDAPRRALFLQAAMRAARRMGKDAGLG